VSILTEKISIIDTENITKGENVLAIGENTSEITQETLPIATQEKTISPVQRKSPSKGKIVIIRGNFWLSFVI